MTSTYKLVAYSWVPFLFFHALYNSWYGFESNYDDTIIQKVMHDMVYICGVRVPGTPANEICGVKTLVRLIKETTNIPDEYIDIQTSTSGSHFLKLIGGMILTYDEVHNVIVKIPKRTDIPKGRDDGCALMIAGHFDSTLGSPGMSDDMSVVAMGVDMIKKIHEEPREVDTLFVFNGAEESHMMGSHAFITQHKWAKQACAFINLESIGPNGIPALFQVNAPWVLKAYRDSVDVPQITSFANSFFGTGVVPGDSDYGIYHRHGLHGADFVTTGDGFRYHTHRDNTFDPNGLKVYAETIWNFYQEMARSMYHGKHLDKVDNAAYGYVFFDIFRRVTFVAPQEFMLLLLIISCFIYLKPESIKIPFFADSVLIVENADSDKLLSKRKAPRRISLNGRSRTPQSSSQPNNDKKETKDDDSKTDCADSGIIENLGTQDGSIVIEKETKKSIKGKCNPYLQSPIYDYLSFYGILFTASYSTLIPTYILYYLLPEQLISYATYPAIIWPLIMTPGFMFVWYNLPDRVPIVGFLIQYILMVYVFPRDFAPLVYPFVFSILFPPLGYLTNVQHLSCIFDLINGITNRTGSIPVPWFGFVLAPLFHYFTFMLLTNKWFPRLQSKKTAYKISFVAIVLYFAVNLYLPVHTVDSPLRTHMQHVIDRRTPESRSYYVAAGLDYSDLAKLNLRDLGFTKLYEDKQLSEKKTVYIYETPLPYPVNDMVLNPWVKFGAPDNSPDISEYATVKYTQEGNTVHGFVEMGDASMITIRIPGDVTEWNWETPIPKIPRDDCNCHFILFVHGGFDEKKYLDPQNNEIYGPLRKDRKMKFSITGVDMIEVHAFYFDKKKIVPDWEHADSDITRAAIPFLSEESIKNDHTLARMFYSVEILPTWEKETN